MRTTIDLPDDLLRAAKNRAAARGEHLEDLFVRALAREVGLPISRRVRARVELPLVGDHQPRVDVTNADIYAALAADDVERFGNG